MTKIIYNRAALSLSMEGHALCDDYGKDIICAAESMLLMCLEKRSACRSSRKPRLDTS